MPRSVLNNAKKFSGLDNKRHRRKPQYPTATKKAIKEHDSCDIDLLISNTVLIVAVATKNSSKRSVRLSSSGIR